MKWHFRTLLNSYRSWDEHEGEQVYRTKERLVCFIFFFSYLFLFDLACFYFARRLLF